MKVLDLRLWFRDQVVGFRVEFRIHGEGPGDSGLGFKV